MAELSLGMVGRRALDELEQLVGCPAEGVTGISKTDHGWTVQVEVLEVERIPETTDVLAAYEVTVNAGGNVTGYRRLRRYLRAQVED
ncbi:MAG TPA: gas vesicle protein GvpO [Actinomycetales bacterium]|nr:gas vesicle protein GvpO [Actinomycetales bacterium]